MSQTSTGPGGRVFAAPRRWHDPREQLTAALGAPWYQMLTGVYAVLLEATARFYVDRRIPPVLMPITVSAVSSPMGLGSDSVPVRVDLLGERVYLADSMQFQLEFLLRHGLPGAYYVMPSFRGEDPDSTHLNQFFHSEAEIVGGLEDVITLVEQYVGALAQALLDHRLAEDIRTVAGGLGHLETLAAQHKLPRITFAEAQALLASEHFETRSSGVPTILRSGEMALIEKHGGAVWLTHPPHLSVPFYQQMGPDGRAECADLLLGVGEVVGCGARHVDADSLREALALHRVDERDYGWYVEMRRRYPMATAGFGMGLERFLLWVLNHDDIRDLHPMPRLKGQPTCV